MNSKGRYTVEFYLKPHLHDFALVVAGGDGFHINMYNVVGCMALSTLTPKHDRQHKVDASFKQPRRRITGSISIEHGRREGMYCSSLPVFETLVEHLFQHMLLTHVDLRRDQGMRQLDAIHEFLELHHVDLDGISIATLKKTIERRRSRVEVNSSAVTKFRATVSLPARRALDSVQQPSARRRAS